MPRLIIRIGTIRPVLVRQAPLDYVVRRVNASSVVVPSNLLAHRKLFLQPQIQ